MIVRAVLCAMLMAFPAHADEASIAKGKALAQENCAICHAVEASGSSILRDAPPFRDIATNYDEGELEDALNEGVATEHTAMPDWQMTAEQAAALASYIMSLSSQGVKKSEVSP